jgi:hypothetical protein
MQKRLIRKLVTLFVLVAAVAAVSTTPASPRRQYICWEMPLDGGCPNNLWCCDASGQCGCG